MKSIVRILLIALCAVPLCPAVTIEIDGTTSLLDSSTFTPGTSYFAVFQLTGATGLPNQASLSAFDFGSGSVFARDVSDPAFGQFILGPNPASTSGIGQTAATLDLSVDLVTSYSLYSQMFTAGERFSFDLEFTTLFVNGIPDQFAFQLYDPGLSALLYEVAIDLTPDTSIPEPGTLGLTAAAVLAAITRRSTTNKTSRAVDRW